jgi:cell division protein FtsI (penicillin-binding protein 3)
LSPDVANQMRGLLLNVVENGTAVAADLSSYLLAGKTGTPRRTVNGRYAAQQYNPNFVGLFPADAPQYVIVVKLTNPRGAQGSYFGGATAAPLTKTVLEAAIAARDAALDRRQLAASREAADAARPVKDSGGGMQVSARTLAFAEGNVASPESARARAARHSVESGGSVPYIVTLPQRASRAGTRGLPRAVPDVRGLDLRDAVRSLHTAGFQVQLLRGSSGITSPVPGTLAAPGTLVRLLYDF